MAMVHILLESIFKYRADLHWKVSSCLRDATDIHRFPIVHMVKTHFLLENLSISEPSLGILQNFQRRSALPNIKYNYAVLFLRQVNYLFNYAPKTKNSTKKKILIDFNVKTLKCIFWPCRISKYFLYFTQGVNCLFFGTWKIGKYYKGIFL